MTHEETDRDQLEPLAGYLPWVLAVLPFALATLRIGQAARFDAATARAIVGDVDVVAVLISVALPFVPMLAVAAGLMALRLARRLDVGFVVGRLLMTTGLFLLAAGLVGSAPFTIVVIVAIVLLAWFSPRSGISSEMSWATALALAVVIAALSSVLMSDEPWVARERVTTEDATVVGYVIADDGRWATILSEEDRAVRRIDSSEIESRELCRGSDGWDRWAWVSRPIIGILASGSPRYPVCPRA